VINFFICKISNDLSDREKLDKILVIRKNQTTDEITTYSEIPNNYIENPGFPDFVEAI
jgi:hypothetical protein cdiviTM7_01413